MRRQRQARPHSQPIILQVMIRLFLVASEASSGVNCREANDRASAHVSGLTCARSRDAVDFFCRTVEQGHFFTY